MRLYPGNTVPMLEQDADGNPVEHSGPTLTMVPESDEDIEVMKAFIVDNAPNNILHNNKQAEINQLKEQISRLESTYDSMYASMLDANQAIMKDLKNSQRDIEGVDVELSVRKQDSKVLMQVVKVIQLYQDDKHGAVSTVIAIKCLLGDYLDVPEVPGILTLQTPSIGTRVVSKVDAPLTVSERAMEAVQLIVECGINRNTWVLYTKDDARDAMRSKQLIDVLNETISDLRHGVCCVNEFSMLCDAQYDQLEKIKKLTTEAISYVHIDEITKILEEK